MIRVDVSGHSRFEWNISPKGRCALCFEIKRLVLTARYKFGPTTHLLGYGVSTRWVLPAHPFCIAPTTEWWMDPKTPVDMHKAVSGISRIYEPADRVARYMIRAAKERKP